MIDGSVIHSKAISCFCNYGHAVQYRDLYPFDVQRDLLFDKGMIWGVWRIRKNVLGIGGGGNIRSIYILFLNFQGDEN